MNTQNPKLSIVVPALNAERYLDATIRTVLDQTFQDWEMVIADGGSKDRTREMLSAYAAGDPRIRPVFKPDESPFHGIWNGVAEARGDYLCILAISDGYLDREWLAKCVAALDTDPELSIVWGIPFDMSEAGEILGPAYVYAHFLEGDFPGRRPSVLKKILTKIDLRHPSSILTLFGKVNRANVVAARQMLGHVTVSQKRDWFHYWLRTGTIFPDGNTVLSRRVFLECMPPYRMGTREPGDWMGFYFNLNSKGYLARCLPTPANSGRINAGQVSEVWKKYNDDNRREYFTKLAAFRRQTAERPGSFHFVDRDGNALLNQ